MFSVDQLRRLFRGKIVIGGQIARYTTFKIGGQADFYFEPADPGDLSVLVNILNERGFPFILLGNRSNYLVSDRGYRGAAINLAPGIGGIRLDGEYVIAGAGATLRDFVDFCIDEGFHGAEMLAGIPGTLGGAIISNERAYGGTISDHLVEVEIIRRGEPVTLSKEGVIFGFKYSSIQDDIVLSAKFKFPTGERSEMKRVRRELLLRRQESHPEESADAGWIFKNPVMNSAARLVETCGMKGFRIGNARVSDKNANFVVNLGGAASSDVVRIITRIEEEVRTESGISLELEVRLLGFTEDADAKLEEIFSRETR